MNLINSIKEITTTWLEEILHTDSGIISDFKISKTFDVLVSQAAIIEIEYKDRSSSLPSSIFLKVSRPEIQNRFPGFGNREVFFYNNLSKMCIQEHLLKCYFAEFDDEKNIYNLVFEDLSKTHYQSDFPLSPHVDECFKAVECFAKFHSYWWDHKDLEKITKKYETKKELQERRKEHSDRCYRFIDFMGKRLSDKRKELILNIVNKYEDHIERYLKYKNLTMLHSDAHYWNFFFPVNRKSNVRIFDWQSYSNGICTDDLAYLLALFSYSDFRHNFELELLKHYHGILIKNNLRNYTLNDLLDDYISSVKITIHVPIIQWENKFPGWVWYNSFERILTANEDIDHLKLS